MPFGDGEWGRLPGKAMRFAPFYRHHLGGRFTMIGLLVALTSALYVNTVEPTVRTGDFRTTVGRLRAAI